MPTLYTIDATLEEIGRQIIENGGESSPELDAQLQQYEFLQADKIDGYYAKITEWETEAEKFEAEAARLKERAVVLRKSRDRLSEHLRRYMNLKGVKELKGILKTVKVRTNGIAPVELLVPEAELPEEWCRVKREADKTKIRDMILAFGDNPFAKLGEKGTSLQWR
jgi:hypothetical protein